MPRGGRLGVSLTVVIVFWGGSRVMIGDRIGVIVGRSGVDVDVGFG